MHSTLETTMTRILKLAIIAVFLAAPFSACDTPDRLAPGTKAFAIDGGIYIPDFDPRVYRHMFDADYRTAYPHLHRGDKLTVLKDEETGPTRHVEVKVESGDVAGELGLMSRADLQPIDNSIGGSR